MSTLNKYEESVQEETTGFSLDLPKELQVEPTFKVPVSPKHIALVFEVQEPQQNRHMEETGATRTRYDTRIVFAKTGVTHEHISYNRFTHLHEVAQWLRDVSKRLNIKRRTRKQVEEESED